MRSFVRRLFLLPKLEPVAPKLTWVSYPDPLRSEATVYEAEMPSNGNYLLVQEVSAGNIWGWLLMSAKNDALEMRNGFDSKEAAQNHAEKYYFGKTATENDTGGNRSPDGGPEAA